MASSYLGPEDPRPLAVISESYRGQLQDRLPELPSWQRYSLGEDYEDQFFALLHKYLELDTTDHLCYVGDTKDCLVHRIQDHFCLLNDVHTVEPASVHYMETEDHKMLPFSMSEVGAEEFFKQLARQAKTNGSKGMFDKILLHDGCHSLKEPAALYQNMAQCLTPGGILLIVHRPARLSTLPFFKDAHHRLADNDLPHINIIRDVQTVPRVDIQWDMETVSARLSRTKWLAMIRDRYPPQMQMMSQTEVLGGLRELTEGILKYEGEQVEFTDQLLFVKASSTESSHTSQAVSQSHSQHKFVPVQFQHNLKLNLKVAPGLKASASTSSRSNTDTSFKFLWD